MKFFIDPNKIANIILVCITFLLFANLAGIVINLYVDYDKVFGLVELFSFDTKKNIPTIFVTMTLLFCALLLLSIAILHKLRRESYRYWMALSALFVFIGLDKIASIHQQLTSSIETSFNPSTEVYFTSMILYSIGILGIFFLFYRILIILPPHIKNLFIFSGFLYLTGVVGFDRIASYHADIHGIYNVTYAFIYTVEVFLEMMGVAVFIYALLSYIKIHFSNSVLYLNTDASVTGCNQASEYDSLSGYHQVNQS